MWTLSAIADALERGLIDAARRLDEEQAVAGLDAMDELRLHPVLAGSLRDAGFGVHAEQRFPSDRAKRSHSEGDRCDLVLTPDGRELAAPDREPTLFDPPDALPLEEAFWVEVKVVAQFAAGGPNPRYASQLLTAARRDVAKLARDRRIRHAALLVVLFAAEDRIARHDLDAFLEACLDRGLAVGAPCRRVLPINERMGNAVCAVALYPLRRN